MLLVILLLQDVVLRRDAPLSEELRDALGWLERHPKPEGCACLAAKEVETELTLLAFLGAGRAPDREVEKLLAGRLDAVGTLALAEAWALTKAERLKEPARKAVEALAVAPGFKDAGKAAFWGTLALGVARDAGLAVPDGAFEGARTWLARGTERGYFRVGDPAERGRGVRVPGAAEAFDHHESMTAVGVVLRRVLGEATTTDPVRLGANLLLFDPPATRAVSVDFFYWHAGALALRHAGIQHRRVDEWREGLGTSLRALQRKEGCAAGSWDPDGRGGGRIAATALNAMTLGEDRRYRFR